MSPCHRRLSRFFGSLYSCLKRGSRAALQFYPQDDSQATLLATAAAKAGFAGGVVVDFPNSAKAKKHYLCLSLERNYRKPQAKIDAPTDRAPKQKVGTSVPRNRVTFSGSKATERPQMGNPEERVRFSTPVAATLLGTGICDVLGAPSDPTRSTPVANARIVSEEDNRPHYFVHP